MKQVIGPVVDIEFPSGKLPKIYNALKISGEREGVQGVSVQDTEMELIVEVMQQLGDNRVRCVALASTDGLVRGMKAFDTGGPITVPVGEEVLGRVLNVLGEVIDRKEELKTEKR